MIGRSWVDAAGLRDEGDLIGLRECGRGGCSNPPTNLRRPEVVWAPNLHLGSSSPSFDGPARLQPPTTQDFLKQNQFFFLLRDRKTARILKRFRKTYLG